MSWTDMQYDQSMYWRDEVQAIAHLAVDTLVQLMVNRGENSHVRPQASTAIVRQMSMPHPLQPEIFWDAQPSVPEDHELQPPAEEKNPRSSVQRTVDLVAERHLPPVDSTLFGEWQPPEYDGTIDPNYPAPPRTLPSGNVPKA